MSTPTTADFRATNKHTFLLMGLTESALFDTVTTRHFVTAFTFYEAK